MKAFAETAKNSDADFYRSGARQNSPLETALWSSVSAPDSNFQIQRSADCACGGDCPACQAKGSDLPVSQPSDSSEIEADQIADKVMRTQITGPINSSSSKNTDEEKLHRKKSGNNSSAPSIVPDVLGSGGKPLDADTRAFMESRFNYDFSNVRIHADEPAAKSASSINALAYTSGNNIVFNAKQYDPVTDSGKRLLAHELTHTIQQNKGTQTKLIQRASPPDSSPQAVDPAGTIPSMLRYLIEWQLAGLLDSPFRPANVAPIPPYTMSPEQASRISEASVGAVAGSLAARSTAAETAAGIGTRTGASAVEIAAQRWGTAAILEGGEAAAAAGATATTTSVGSAALSRVALIASRAAVPLTLAAILLTPITTAPPWMDETSQITGEPYSSPEDYTWQRRLSPGQADYLRYLSRARRLAPDPAVDEEPIPAPDPAPSPEPDGREPNGCVSRNVARLGGNARHDAYATKVTGSPFDYLVWPGVPTLPINYDGHSDPRRVWEVKVGHGWFFNPAMSALRNIVLARWDAQKNLGLSNAALCGYLHLWSIPDRYVANLLILRWGGTPPVLSLPE